jgi:membrane-bound lytic murein transglycosylase B
MLLNRIIFLTALAMTVAACSHAGQTPPVSVAATKPQSPVATKATPQPATAKPAAVAAAPQADKNAAGFAVYVKGLRQEAEAAGYPKTLLDQVFPTLKFHHTVVKADKGQPEFVETLDTYLPKRVNAQRIKMAREAYQKYQAELAPISEKYGVPARFIVSLWGLESAFGRITGNYSVPSALATMAYEGRREAMFRREFFLALDILRDGHVTFASMKGSWAGAMGHTQFMPSAFMKYAQDGDGDGHKDIWTNRLDAFASIASYLKTEGWQNGQSWGRQVRLPKNFDYARVIPKGSKDRAQWLQWWRERELPLSQWQKLGVRLADGSPLPTSAMKAAVVMPDDKDGRAYLAYPNYQVLMHWNRSYYFVSSVGYLADEIVAKPAAKKAAAPAP